ncbi:MAG: efflux transporter outer membrane subunit [Gemmatimonadaceae bacterium]
MMHSRLAMRFGAPALAAALVACAVGPSTAVTPVVASIDQGGEGAVPPAARSFYDSLSAARASGRADSTPQSQLIPSPQALLNPATLELNANQDLAWLDIVRDSTLVTLIQTAIENNRDLRVAHARILEYHALQGAAMGPLFPQITANVSASENKIALGGGAPIKYNAIRATGDVSWELDFWGRIRRGAEAAKFDLLGREQDARATELTLVSEVATAYLQLRELDESIRIAEATRVAGQAVLGLAQKRFNEGQISELDVRQFEAQVADPAARLAQFALQRRQQENGLSLLLGEPPGRIPRGAPLQDVLQAVIVPDSIPGALIARRPDVLRAQRDMQAALARIGVAIANRLPSITVSGDYGAQRPEFTKLFSGQGDIYTVQAGLSFPLFTGGRLLNQQRAARARADEAKSQYQQTVLVALNEAANALAGVKLGHDQLVAQQTQARALTIAASIAERRYASGISSYLEVLTAEQSLFNAQLNLVLVEQQYLVATVQLYKALGGSWVVVAAH